MENAQINPMTIDEKFELAFRLIERYDNLLTSLESRAATVVSADALLLAGTTFLIDKIFSQGYQYSLLEQIFISVTIGLALIALALSLVYATMGIANVRKTTREIAGGDLSKSSLFFHARETVRELKELSHFDDSFRTSNKEQMLTYALSELWLITNLNVRRYRSFQRAVQLLLFSVIPFLVLAAYATLAIR
jgi:hypothetical protein